MKLQVWVRIILLASVTFAVYGYAVYGNFLWDDTDYVVNNTALNSVEGLRQIWFEPGSVPNYYPLFFTALWLVKHFAGLDPFYFHLLNIVLHIGNAFLVWYLLSALGLRYAYIVALFFAVHPVHVESVAWISELKNTLSTFFYLCSFAAFGHYSGLTAQEGIRFKKSAGIYAVSFLCFLLALFSKTAVCTLPLAALLVTYWKRQKIQIREIFVLLPYFIAGLFMGLISVIVEKMTYAGAFDYPWKLSFMERFLIAGRALWFYPAKLIWPFPLMFFYPKWEINAGVFWLYSFWVGIVLVSIILWRYRRCWGRATATALLVYAVMIFPALGFADFENMRYIFVADHFQYLASIPLLALIVSGVGGLLTKWKISPRIVSGIIGVAVLALSVRTFYQGKFYLDKFSLYTEAVTQNPLAWLAYHDRGVLYILKGEYGKALNDLNRAIKINPGYPYAYSNRGNVFAYTKQYDLALKDYGKALELKPDDWVAFHGRGEVYFNQRKLDLSIGDFTRALIYAKEPKTYFLRSRAYYLKKDYERAREDALQASSRGIAIDWRYLDRLDVLNIKDTKKALKPQGVGVRENK